jgi:DNA-binding transcriptional LysR family regulator
MIHRRRLWNGLAGRPAAWSDGGVDARPPLRDIGCFAAVARHLSFSHAAAELGMSQPAVSQAIARLERTLGLRLFERTSREVYLSDDGKVLLPYAEALLGQAAAFGTEAARLASESAQPQPIRLAYCPLVGTLAARVTRRLAGKLELELRPAGWSTAAAELSQGVVPAALMSTPFPAGLASTARFHVPVSRVAVPTGSPLARASRIGPVQLAHADVLVPRERPAGSFWTQLVPRLRGSRLVPEDLDDPTAGLDLVAAGRGLLVVPQLLAASVRRPDVTFLPHGLGPLRMTYGLVWRDEDASAQVTRLVQAVQDVLRTR